MVPESLAAQQIVCVYTIYRVFIELVTIVSVLCFVFCFFLPRSI